MRNSSVCGLSEVRTIQSSGNATTSTDRQASRLNRICADEAAAASRQALRAPRWTRK